MFCCCIVTWLNSTPVELEARFSDTAVCLEDHLHLNMVDMADAVDMVDMEDMGEMVDMVEMMDMLTWWTWLRLWTW